MAGKKTAEFMIVNRRSGKALQATGLDNGLVVEQAEPAKTDAQTWTSLETEGGVKFFNKACGKVLDVMANGTANGTWSRPGRMWTAKASCGSWSLFPLRIKRLSTSWPTRPWTLWT